MKRKGFLYNVLLCAALVFLPFLSGNAAKEKNDSLKDVSKTYLGVYECKEMRYGGNDLCEYINSATLELKNGGLYEVNVTFKNGDKKKADGRYEATKDKITLIYRGNKGEMRREFSRKEGKITIATVLHGKPLYLVFSRGA
ncbi:MAG: hypothetical protein ACI4RO_01460 [Candidatus Scatosoma sp.]